MRHDAVPTPANYHNSKIKASKAHDEILKRKPDNIDKLGSKRTEAVGAPRCSKN